jgi:aspartyl-tRNA(Asn)/glutamyl-tRNA(Gln) amidotransferase subunit A
MSEIAALDACDLGALFRSGALSPVEVARDVLARIEGVEPALNAFVVRDAAVTLAIARASETRFAKNAPLGPLDGVPVTIKDNIVVAGWPTRRGSAVSDAAPAPEDSPLARSLRAAGAVFLGKTTMPEYGWKGCGDSPLTGITRNPWDLATGPGGSSSGAAACAALNLGAIHFGTDGAGSVRIPASFAGVVGLKPSYGRLPAFPVSTMGVLAHLGPLTRSVRDAALAMSIVNRPDPRDMTALLANDTDDWTGLERGVSGLRIAWSPTLGQSHLVDPEVAALTEASAKRFQDLGVIVEEADPALGETLKPLMTLWSAGAALALRSATPEARGRMDPGLVAIAEAGERVTGADYAQALLNERAALASAMAVFHQRFDLLLTPTLAVPAFEAGRLTPRHGGYGEDWTAWTPFTYPFNLTQQPAISVPCGLTRAGLPVGLQIVGPFGADRLVLRAASAFEAMAPFARIDQPRETRAGGMA